MSTTISVRTNIPRGEAGDITVTFPDGSVPTAMLADSGVTEAKLGGARASGLTKGGLASQYLESAELEALLDTNTNNLFALKAGDVLLAVVLITQTGAGEAAVADVGLDADVIGNGAATDALIIDHDLNAAGFTDSRNEASAYRHGIIAAADGYVTITSDTDESSSAFVGSAMMLYIPA